MHLAEMFKGVDPTTGVRLETGDDARRTALESRWNDADIEFIRKHCVIIPSAPEIEPRNCCMRNFKSYCCVIIILIILTLILWYYVF